MQHVTYQLLIAEHDAIDSAADDMLCAAIGTNNTSHELANRLNGLANLVAAHIQKESQFVSGLDQDHLVGQWINDWKAGLAEFDRLCDDWEAYLSRWDEEGIRTNRRMFSQDTGAMIERLRSRVRDETATLYLAALQSGAVRLR